jgi:PKD repeat protein
MPRAFVLEDTLILQQNQAVAQFYNNNAYVDSWSWDFGDGGSSQEKDPMHTYTDTGTYTAIVTVSSQGCVKTAQRTVVVELGTSINEIENFNYAFKIFPNPTSGSVTIECNLPENTKGEICLYNAFGSKEKQIPVTGGSNSVLLNTEHLAKGVSLCGLHVNGKQVCLEKIVKE